MDSNEGARSCAKCGQVMGCELVRAHYRGWMYVGSTYSHVCTGCGTRIRTISNWKAMIDLGAASLMAVMCLGLAAMMAFDAISRALAGVPMQAVPWGTAIGPAVLGAIFVGFGAWSFVGVANRRRHPLLR